MDLSWPQKGKSLIINVQADILVFAVVKILKIGTAKLITVKLHSDMGM